MSRSRSPSIGSQSDCLENTHSQSDWSDDYYSEERKSERELAATLEEFMASFELNWKEHCRFFMNENTCNSLLDVLIPSLNDIVQLNPNRDKHLRMNDVILNKFILLGNLSNKFKYKIIHENAVNSSKILKEYKQMRYEALKLSTPLYPEQQLVVDHNDRIVLLNVVKNGVENSRYVTFSKEFQKFLVELYIAAYINDKNNLNTFPVYGSYGDGFEFYFVEANYDAATKLIQLNISIRLTLFAPNANGGIRPEIDLGYCFNYYIHSLFGNDLTNVDIKHSIELMQQQSNTHLNEFKAKRLTLGVSGIEYNALKDHVAMKRKLVEDLAKPTDNEESTAENPSKKSLN